MDQSQDPELIVPPRAAENPFWRIDKRAQEGYDARALHKKEARHAAPVRGRLRILVVNIAGVLVILFFPGLLVYGAYLVVHGGRWCSAHPQAGSLASV